MNAIFGKTGNWSYVYVMLEQIDFRLVLLNLDISWSKDCTRNVILKLSS